MNDTLTRQIETVMSVPESSPSLGRARLYHFFELALAHPGEDGHAYFCEEATEGEFMRAYSAALADAGDLQPRGIAAGRRFFERLRRMPYEDVESAHIGLFTNNYPHLPCPPYGSLFTAQDGDKRLEEMLAIKQFYQANGVDIADTFDDLPDHLCVELEFVQLMCFRADEAERAGDAALAAGVRENTLEFMDRFLLPFATRLAEIAPGAEPDNPYADLLEATCCALLAHRRALGGGMASSANVQENPS
jgi:TorA maturation chaperone TorD